MVNINGDWYIEPLGFRAEYRVTAMVTPMPHQDSVTRWFHEMKDGNAAAAVSLWSEYFDKLVRLARKKLQGVAGRMADEEDVALSAFKSFCLAAESGRFPNLADRDDLWRLLIQLTARKAVDLRRFEGRARRGGGRVWDTGEDFDDRLAQVISDTPTPEFAALAAEEVEERLKMLEPDHDLRDLALAKLEGYSNREIAERFGYALRTVERRLNLIRIKWAQDRDDER